MYRELNSPWSYTEISMSTQEMAGSFKLQGGKNTTLIRENNQWLHVLILIKASSWHLQAISHKVWMRFSFSEHLDDLQGDSCWKQHMSYTANSGQTLMIEWLLWVDKITVLQPATISGLGSDFQTTTSNHKLQTTIGIKQDHTAIGKEMNFWYHIFTKRNKKAISKRQTGNCPTATDKTPHWSKRTVLRWQTKPKIPKSVNSFSVGLTSGLD